MLFAYPSSPSRNVGTIGDMHQTPVFRDVADVRDRLAEVGYLADDSIATTVFLADRLGKPLLVEGPAGTGKTELAKSVAAATESSLIRLQCYEGLDEARALYEWNYKKQLLRIQATNNSGTAGSAEDTSWSATSEDIFSEEFLLERPLLHAIRQDGPAVLLVDETDKADVEVEGLLLEVLSDFQVTIPELGTIVATRRPFVVLTSNATRELSEALKRRCLFLHLDYPSAEREKAIVLARVPELSEQLAESLVRTARAMRAMELKKSPSIAESIDWAHTLLALGLDTLDEAAVSATLGVVLKHAADQDRARTQLKLS
jgi:MoxR-like ATPase